MRLQPMYNSSTGMLELGQTDILRTGKNNKPADLIEYGDKWSSITRTFDAGQMVEF